MKQAAAVLLVGLLLLMAGCDVPGRRDGDVRNTTEFRPYGVERIQVAGGADCYVLYDRMIRGGPGISISCIRGEDRP